MPTNPAISQTSRLTTSPVHPLMASRGQAALLRTTRPPQAADPVAGPPAGTGHPGQPFAVAHPVAGEQAAREQAVREQAAWADRESPDRARTVLERKTAVPLHQGLATADPAIRHPAQSRNPRALTPRHPAQSQSLRALNPRLPALRRPMTTILNRTVCLKGTAGPITPIAVTGWPGRGRLRPGRRCCRCCPLARRRWRTCALPAAGCST